MKTTSIVKGMAVAMLGLAAAAYAREGSGVRGGGQIVDVNSTPELMDLATNAVCDWQPGSDVVAAHSSFQQHVIDPLGKLDWYFADDLLNEARTLRFCFTGPLYRVTPSDPNSPVLPPDQKDARQIGYRLNETIYIDSALFNDPKMSEYQRAYVILHEVIHSYFPMDLQDRQLKLRSMVKAISSVDSGTIATRKDLYFQMHQNEVAFPTVADALDPYRAQIEYLVERADKQEHDLTTLSASAVDAIINLPQATIANLAPWDNQFLTSYSPKEVLSQACLQRMIDETTQGFSEVLADPALQEIDPSLIALGNAQKLSPEKQAILMSGDFRKAVYDSVFASIMNAKLALQADGRTTLDANPSEALGVQSGLATPILDLPMPTVLPPDFASVANLIILYAKTGQWDLMNGFAGPGSPFADVLGLQPIHQAIAQAQFTYTIEKEFSDRRVSLLSQQLTQLMTSYFKNALTSDDFNHVVQIVFAKK